MGFFLLLENIREFWKEWELRLLVLLSLFLQLILASQGTRRKSIIKNWIQVMAQATYLADSIAILTLGVLSNQLANIKETKGMIDPKSQITACWAPFLLLHLGGTDLVTAFTLIDLELWRRQLAQLCIKVGLASYIYSMALLGSSTLSILAAGMTLVGFISYAERTLCLYWASKGPLRKSMLPCPDVTPIYPRKMEQFTLKDEEGYWVGVDVITQTLGPENLSVHGGQDPVVQAYKLFEIYKLLFVGLAVNSVDLDVTRCMFKDWTRDPRQAFEIVDIELGFMYDLLFSKAPLLKCAWGIVRWIISLSVLCAVLVFFSLQDKKDYAKVDICITFLLISAAILLEIYSLLQAISSDWIHHWRLQRPERSVISFAINLLQFRPSQRWSNAEGQFSLLRSSIRKKKSIFRHLRFAKLDEMVNKKFYIEYEPFDKEIKNLILEHVMQTVQRLDDQLSPLASLNMDMRRLLKLSNGEQMLWTVGMEFHREILIWHIATELRHSEDSDRILGEDAKYSKTSMLISRYMLYLLVFYPSMLPIGIGMLRYEDTVVEAQKFFDDELAMLCNDEDSSISSVVVDWARKLFKKEAHVHTHFRSCSEAHESRELRDLCEVCWLLLQVRTDLPAWNMRGAKSTSVLFDACHLAHQLKSIDTWYILSHIWVRLLIYAAYQCKGYEHCESLSRGGELLTHVWLLLAHLGIAQPVQTSEERIITKLIVE